MRGDRQPLQPELQHRSVRTNVLLLRRVLDRQQQGQIRTQQGTERFQGWDIRPDGS